MYNVIDNLDFTHNEGGLLLFCIQVSEPDVPATTCKLFVANKGALVYQKMFRWPGVSLLIGQGLKLSPWLIKIF